MIYIYAVRRADGQQVSGNRNNQWDKGREYVMWRMGKQTKQFQKHWTCQHKHRGLVEEPSEHKSNANLPQNNVLLMWAISNSRQYLILSKRM